MDIKIDKASPVPRWRIVIFISMCYLSFGTPERASAIQCPGRLISASLSSRTSTTLEDNAAWMKDPYQVSDRLFYMGYTQYRSRRLFEYENIHDLSGGEQAKKFYQIPYAADGTGFVVYDRNLFFTPERTRKIVRFDPSTNRVGAEVELPAANYDGTSPYGIELATDIDLAVDEAGLWAIYATEYNQGNIVISRIEHNNLKIEKTWTTDYYKLSALNAFMMCGVLYAVNYDTLTIDYMFNTTSNIGTKINIPVPGLTQTVSTINYNPNEQKLYIWDTKKAVTYQLNFEPITVAPPTTIKTTTTTSTTISTTTRKIFPSVSSVSPFPFKCVGGEAKGLYWPDTKYRDVAQLNCPGSSSGYTQWICGGNVTHPQWTTKDPDFSLCISKWILKITRELNSGRSNAVMLSQRFVEMLQRTVNNREEIRSWDIVTSVQLMSDFLRQTTTESQNAADLTGALLKIVSLLLDPHTEKAWNALAFTMQNEVASQLVNTIEDAAFFLAYHISTGIPSQYGPQEINKTPVPKQNKLNWSEEMVSLGITVDPIPYPGEYHTVQSYENVFWSSGKGDTIKVETNSVVESLAKYDSAVSDITTSKQDNVTTTRHLAVVLLSFKNLGQYLKDVELYQTHLQPVNSKILTVSAASIKRTTTAPTGTSARRSPTSEDTESVIVNRHQTLSLARPVRMTITHEADDRRYHVCAYWDYSEGSTVGYWSRNGCRLVTGNATHSTCECDHMTSFAVLSSNLPFPPMGYDGAHLVVTTDDPVFYPYVSRDLPVLRAGLAISLLFLIIVAFTLFALSISRRLQSDINTIHKNLILSLIATEIVFMFGIDRTVVPHICGAVAALLHFGLLSTFTWAALESFHLMAVLSDITERRDRWRWYYCIGYGIPTVVVAVSAAVDHAGYGTVSFCWLKTDGNFIWSFIGPCCFVIVCCILFLAITVYRLHLYSVNFADAPKDKTIRSGVARSCVLMFLLCALWSCGVLWLSNFQPRLTAILFCTFSSFYGIASFILYCILPVEVRKCYTQCFYSVTKKSHTQRVPRSRHASATSHMGRFGSTTSHAGTLRAEDHHSTYGGYYATTTGCTTTLLPVSEAQSQIFAKSALDQSYASASAVNCTLMSSLTNPQYAIQGHRGQGSAPDLTNETNPNPHVNHFNRPCTASCTGWSEYGAPHGSETGPHQYEQHYPHMPHCSTISSGASGTYNHLHENYPSGSHHHLACGAMMTKAPQGSKQFTPHPHLYETMDHPLCKNCPPGLGVQLQVNENGEPKVVQYRHCAEDAQHQTVCYTAPMRRNPPPTSYPCCSAAMDPHYRTCVGSMENMNHQNLNGGEFHHGVIGPTHHTLAPDNRFVPQTTQAFDSLDSDNSFSTRRSQIKMGTSGLQMQGPRANLQAPQRRQRSGNQSKTGRSSDPLSTDQGYDTDSQQLGGGTHSDTDLPYCPRSTSGPKPTLVVRSVENAAPKGTRLRSVVENTISDDPSAPISNRKSVGRVPRSSVSDGSECASENDLEVERITNFASESASSSPATHEDSGNYDADDVTMPQSSGKYLNDAPVEYRHNDEEEMIDTECGGRLSVAESTNSWSAHPGSNPRAARASYGRNMGRNKKTSDPRVILANARQQSQDRQADEDEHLLNANTQNPDNEPTRRNKKYTYTLPGTEAAGTKAKIDLKNGGISMITNL